MVKTLWLLLKQMGGGGYKVRFYSGWQLVGVRLCTVVNYSQIGYSLSGGLLIK